MSLDVYLESDNHVGETEERIFIREDGRMLEIPREEWDIRNPGVEPVVCESESELFHANITHNLNTMAGHAGLYELLWRPDENGITTAKELVEPLSKGLVRLLCDPEKFRQYNPENGWGDYDSLVQFVCEYIKACATYPEASVRVWR